MPENYTSLMIMVVVLVVVCGIIGVWTLRSRRRNAAAASSGTSPERRDASHAARSRNAAEQGRSS